MPKLSGVIIIATLFGVGSCIVQTHGSSVALNAHFTVAQEQSAQLPSSLLQRSIPVSYQDAGLGLSDISVVGRDNLWVVGHKRKLGISPTESLLLHSSNGGRSWQNQLSDQAHYFFDVWFVNTQVGWMCGADGLILKSTDGGGRWARQDAPTGSDLIEIQFIDQDRGWAIGEDGEVLRTTDGGLHWVSHHIEAHAWVYFLNFSDRHQGWIVGEKNQAYQSTDGGISWKSRGKELVNLLDKRQMHEADFRAVKFTNPRVGFIAALVSPKKRFENERNIFRKGVVFKTEDGGRRWTVFFEMDGLELLSAEFISSNEAWIVHMHDNELLHTRGGGEAWASESNLPGHGLSHVYFADSNNGWAQIGRGWLTRLFLTTDGGRTWAESKLPEH